MDTNIKNVHLTAICGMGMGAFAGILALSGYKVTGSDQNVYPPMSTQLEKMGIKLMSPYGPENLNHNPDLVIIGNAVKKDNPEITEVMRKNIPYMSFPEALEKLFLKDRTSLVVAGTHGKTTTCSMIAWILEYAEKDPSFLIGGILNNFNASYKLGKGKYFVVEGDEYNTSFFDKGPKFLHYNPLSALLTSVEFDHGDIYRDIEHIKEAFTGFVKLIPPQGILLACGDFPHVMEVAPFAVCKVETYGYGQNNDWTLKDLELGEEYSTFSAVYQGEVMGNFTLPAPGKHNAVNALGAAALLFREGLSMDLISSALSEFEGVKRRQEIRGMENGIRVIDDFAHHPTKVRETVSAIRSKYKKGNVWAIFEPRTNSSRRAFFQKDYVSSFDDATKIIVAGVFNKELIDENERFDSEKLVKDLCERGKEAYYIPMADDISDYVASQAVAGDTVLVMSNGGFDGIHNKLLEKIKESAVKVG